MVELDVSLREWSGWMFFRTFLGCVVRLDIGVISWRNRLINISEFCEYVNYPNLIDLAKGIYK